MRAKSPIERMIDVRVRCTRCGKPPGCACWPTVDLVTIRCPCCKRTGRTDRMPDDPPGPAVVDVTCPECSDVAGDCDHGRTKRKRAIVDAFNAHEPDREECAEALRTTSVPPSEKP